MSSWPGIPEGRGNTCAEEGCGNPRRPKGHDCRKCYNHKRIKHGRATGQFADGAGGYEVPMTRAVKRDLDRKAYDEWDARRSDG